MKLGHVVCKSAGSDTAAPEMELINQFTRKELSAEEVYTFPVVMCDNNVDRDYESFTVDALKELAPMFLGKTVIFDHARSAGNQTGRIYKTEVVKTAEKTSENEDLYQLTAKVYILKNDSTKDIIDSIDGGILKEVSVSCRATGASCSICGNDYYSGKCEHYAGATYDKKLCTVHLYNPVDAYELSFVAVPAQPGVGVMKWYSGGEKKPLENKKQKGTTNMGYEEASKALAKLGVDLGAISKDKQLPELSVILDEVSKAFDKYTEENIILAKSAAENVLEKGIKSEDVITALSESKVFKEKAAKFDEIKKSVTEKALTNGVKAKGEAFDRERWEKNFDTYSIDEIEKQSKEWFDEAAKALNAGSRKSEVGERNSVSMSDKDLDAFKIF